MPKQLIFPPGFSKQADRVLTDAIGRAAVARTGLLNAGTVSTVAENDGRFNHSFRSTCRGGPPWSPWHKTSIDGQPQSGAPQKSDKIEHGIRTQQSEPVSQQNS